MAGRGSRRRPRPALRRSHRARRHPALHAALTWTLDPNTTPRGDGRSAAADALCDRAPRRRRARSASASRPRALREREQRSAASPSRRASGGRAGCSRASRPRGRRQAHQAEAAQAALRLRHPRPRAARLRLLDLRDHDGRRPGPALAREPPAVQARRELGRLRRLRQQARDADQQPGPDPARLRRRSPR